MANQLANNVVTSDGVTKDELLQVYGRIQGDIVAGFISQQLKNTNYTSEPVRGGTVHVKRMKSAVSQAYGTARAAAAANKLQNNGVDVKVDTDKEVAEEMNAKDVRLYDEQGGLAILQGRQTSFANAMGVELENAYFLALQTAASVFDTTAYSGVAARALALIRKLESVTNGNVQKVDRALMILTLAPEIYDDLETYAQTLPNPLNGGVDAKFFHRVRIEPAVRQTVDAVIQVVGSMAQPVVMGEFKVGELELSADKYAYLPYFYGTKAVMPDLIFKAAISSDNNLSA